jgi:hypothetical protein
VTILVDSNLDFQNVNKALNLPTPTGPGDAASKSYVDAAQVGVLYKTEVIAASIGVNVSITAPGANLDGVALAAGNRILLKDQTTGSQNGLWVWNSSATALTRPTDFATGATEEPGAGVFVEAGTVNANSLWVMNNTANVTVDTTAETWAQASGTSLSFTAPLTKTGSVVSLPTLPVANGGTGSTTAAGARTNLSATGKYATTVGDGASTSIAVTHNLGTTDVTVNVYDMATGNLELAQVTITGTNTLNVVFGSAPAAAGGAIGSGTGKRVVVVG